MRALVRNGQEHLAKQLDEELAERYIKKIPALAGTSPHSLSLLLSSLTPSYLLGKNYTNQDTFLISEFCYEYIQFNFYNQQNVAL